MNALSLFFTHAAIGIAITAYLIRKRKAEEKPVCPIGGNCQLVLSSKYNRIFGIYNDLLGLVFYLVVAILAGLLVVEVGPAKWWNTIIFAGVSVGVLMSIRFIYLQWRVIGAWCTWCLLSALTIFDMALIILLSNFELLP